MCQFISWKEYKGNNYFLTNEDLDTKEGKELLKPDVIDDLCGHGAIENYYPELKGKGVNKECTDFTTPDNFPSDIVETIKAGKLSEIGICLDVLNDKGIVEYEKIQQPVYAEYKKIRESACAKYEKIKESAYVEYLKIQQPAWDKYKKIQRLALAEYEKIKQLAYTEYEKIKQNAFASIVTQAQYRKDNWK